MDKQTFIAEINRCLGNMSEAFRREVSQDLDEHFREGYARGMTEEDICRSLGQADYIAAQYLEGYTGEIAVETSELPRKSVFESSPGNNPPVRADEERTKPEQSGYPLENNGKMWTAEELYSMTERPANSKTIDIDRTFTGISDVDIRLRKCNLTILPAQGGEFRLTVKGYSRYDKFTVENQNGRLYIAEEESFFKFEVFFFRVKVDATLWVPESFSGDISAKVTNGTMLAENIRGNKLSLKNTAQDIRVDGCRFGHVNIRATAGNIKAEDNTGDLDIHGTAGNISIQRHKGEHIKAGSTAGNVFISEAEFTDLETSTTAGNVDILSDNIALRDVNARSAAGNITVNAEQTRVLNLRSSAGNINANIKNITGGTSLASSAGDIRLTADKIAGNITAESSAGSIKMRLPKYADCRVKIDSRMGGKHCGIEGNKQSQYELRAFASLGNVRIDPI